jgi:hypothetical protein
MNKCVLQFWEESIRDFGIIPDGCSLHIDLDEHRNFLKSFYDKRDGNAPDEYDRIFGDEIVCFISDSLYNNLLDKNSIRLLENEKNNLISMEEIIINYNEVI